MKTKNLKCGNIVLNSRESESSRKGKIPTKDMIALKGLQNLSTEKQEKRYLTGVYKAYVC